MENSSILTNWIICCHADKALTEEEPVSIYNKKIQAGAACTDIRICEINDHDGFFESISDRNPMYSEATAMFWISKHIDSDYIGISHYRRRFDISDDKLAQLMEEGFDIISSIPVDAKVPVADNYKRILYSADWDLFMSIVKQEIPNDYELIQKLALSSSFHSSNMNIFRASVYKEFSLWMFPILDRFWKESVPKYDVYQRRNTGFMAEFLSSVFVEKSKINGLKIIEKPIYQLGSVQTDTLNECDMNDATSVYEACDRLYKNHFLMRSSSLLFNAIDKGGISEEDERIADLVEIFALQDMERSKISAVMSDYLPDELKENLDVVRKVYGGLKQMLITCLSNFGDESLAVLQKYLELTGFSRFVVENILERSSAQRDTIDLLLERLTFKN